MKKTLVVVAAIIYLAGWSGASMALYNNCKAVRAEHRSAWFEIIVGSFWPVLYMHSRVYEQLAVTPEFGSCRQPAPLH